MQIGLKAYADHAVLTTIKTTTIYGTSLKLLLLIIAYCTKKVLFLKEIISLLSFLSSFSPKLCKSRWKETAAGEKCRRERREGG